MINLRGLANRTLQTISPDREASLRRSTGFTTSASGLRTPSYDTFTGPIQLQSASGRDIQHLNGMNITGIIRKIYLDGRWDSLVRSSLKGGDLFVFCDFGEEVESVWLVTPVTEQWETWCSVMVVRQIDEACA